MKVKIQSFMTFVMSVIVGYLAYIDDSLKFAFISGFALGAGIIMVAVDTIDP